MWPLLAANGYRILWRVVVVILLCVFFYAAVLKPYLKPNPTSVQSGGVAYTIHVGFGGCARIPEIKASKLTPIVDTVKTVIKK